MRLIDADELKNLPFERMIHTDFGDTAIPIEEIDNAPTVTYPFYQEAYQTGYEEGKIERPQGEWIFPLYDVVIGKKRKGRSEKQCSVCKQIFTNNLPWDARFCPNCGSDNQKVDE